MIDQTNEDDSNEQEMVIEEDEPDFVNENKENPFRDSAGTGNVDLYYRATEVNDKNETKINAAVEFFQQ